MNASYVVTDPKGTIINDVGHMLEKGKYRIKVFNTVNFSKSIWSRQKHSMRSLQEKKLEMKVSGTMRSS